jgi:hypothetical protein
MIMLDAACISDEFCRDMVPSWSLKARRQRLPSLPLPLARHRGARALP